MRGITIIGIGAGNPKYLTLQAIEAIGRADVFFVPDKGEEKAALKAVRAEILSLHARAGHRRIEFAVPERERTGDYRAGVDAWRAALRDAYRGMVEALDENATGAFLVWGDPAIYDGTIGILDELRAAGVVFALDVIPGISAVQALAAQHRVPLNRVGETITVTTARRVLAGEADALSSFVVMLDSEGAWTRFIGQDAEIFWGAYVGIGEELLVAGKLDDVADEIARVRAEARARNGWIMDTYMIRRKL